MKKNKKIVIGILIICVVASISVLLVANYNKKQKEKVKEAFSEKDDTRSISILGKDLSDFNLSKEYDKLSECTFDTKTKFPDKMPDNFDPKKVFNDGKNETLRLGIKELHEEGITGKGIGIAVIDGPILTNHKEYKDSIKHYEFSDRVSKNAKPKMHGTAICSILCGKNVGVAPDANIYYVVDDFDKFLKDNSTLGEDINKILEFNKTLPEKNKIRVISISEGGERKKTKGYREYIDALKKAKAEGILVISTSIEEREDMAEDKDKFSYMGLSKIKGKDTKSKDSYCFASWVPYNKENADWYQTELCVPMDGMTLASEKGASEYTYYCHCGLSWSTPYVAAVYALACQVKPDVTYDEFFKAAMATSDHVVNKDGNKKYEISHLINCKKLIESLKNN